VRNKWCALLINGDWIELFDLLTSYTHNSGLQAITTLSLIYTLPTSSLHTNYDSQSSLAVSWQRFDNSLSLQITYENFFAPCNYFLSIILSTQVSSSAPKFVSWQAGVSKLDSVVLNLTLFYITTLHGLHRKDCLSIVGKAYFQRSCIKTEVTRLLFANVLPQECDYTVVAKQWTFILISLFRL
jgi:hypothetical protein